MITRRGLLIAIASSTAAIGLTGLSERAANAAKTYTVCKTSEVPLKGGKTFTVAKQKILITQPKTGTFKAFYAICTHAGSTLTGATNNEIKCQSHGAKFDATTGMAKAVASSPLGKLTVTVSKGSIKVSI
jgi:nitrite reductase/ring-hydroxylating ferredoxin subunit